MAELLVLLLVLLIVLAVIFYAGRALAIPDPVLIVVALVVLLIALLTGLDGVDLHVD